MRIIVFDLDGTLIDSRGDIVACANHVLAAHGRPQRSPEEISSFVGDGARMLMSRASRMSPDAPELEPLLADFLSYYTAHPADHTTMMPGVEGAMESLAQSTLTVCTNKPRGATDAVLRALGLHSRFAMVVAGGDTVNLKPHPEPLLNIAAHFGMQGADLVMVGDGPQDIEAGHAAGARTIGVLGNLLPETRLRASKPEILLHSMAELPEALARLDYP